MRWFGIDGWLNRLQLKISIQFLCKYIKISGIGAGKLLLRGGQQVFERIADKMVV